MRRRDPALFFYMPKICYISRNFGDPVLQVIDSANEILRIYENLGYDMTLRQVYYQMIAKDLFPETWIDNNYNRKKGLPDGTKNTEKNYDRFGEILNAARLGGLVDWNSLTDITRNLRRLAHWDSPEDIIEGAAQQFRIDKWQTQPCYVEVWIEKDALINIMEKVCNELDVPYFSCRGYTSQSEMWTAGRRLMEKIDEGREVIVKHFGDHDPSGFDMTRDIQERLSMFADFDIQVDRVALTMEQIVSLNAPPNPAKITDSRAKKYIERFGNSSWELDAIEPPQMAQLVRDEVTAHIDDDLWQTALDEENEAKGNLELMAREYENVVEYLKGFK